MRYVVDDWAGKTPWQDAWPVSTTVALFQARRRLSIEPLAQLFAQVGRPLGDVTRPASGIAGGGS